MRVIFIMGHPAHVHLFRHVIYNLKERGHEVKIIARDKDCTLELLNAYDLKYELVDVFYGNVFMKLYGLIKTDLKVYRIARRFNPDVMCGVLDPYIAQVGRLTETPSIIFTDTEDATLANLLTIPFADVVCTPSCFKKQFKRHVRYNGYHELAYLHPNYFKPNLSILERLELSKDDTFIVVRFISWKASHDISLKGIENKLEFIKTLEKHGRVFISSEQKLNNTLERYRLKIPAKDVHTLLHYASLYIGEGGTMAAEAAILGTPAIHIESTKNGIPTGELSGNFRELRYKYDLLYFYSNQNEALSTALKILEDDRSKKMWLKKRRNLIRDKIDVTRWITDFIENYPVRS